MTNGALAAGGFSLVEQGGLGNAYAGGAAGAQDASTIYYNPAGMSRLNGTQITAGFSAIRPTAQFTPSTAATGALLQTTGNNGGDPGSLGIAPNGYIAMEINPALRIGLGVNVPFGLQTNYDATWTGRFQAIKSAIKTINLNPSFSYQTSDRISLGFGLNYQRISGELTSMTNYSVAAASYGIPGVGSNSQGLTTISGSDSAWGYNLGTLIDVSSQTRAGFSYRSAINYTLNGTVNFANRPSVLAAGIPDGAVTLPITMPDTFSASVFHQLNGQWDLMADATRTGWSVLQNISINRATGANLLTIPENWKNTWRYAIGANRHYNDQWTVRMGLAYDQTPVPDAFRTAGIPDQNLTWMSLGMQYKPDKNTAINLAYAHLFIANAPIASNQANTGNGNLAGVYSAIATNILSAQCSYNF
ncbi:MAG: outer membrane protein transport protein [Proteobacteria bacterium]|nr:outer membrane protein transport protein [Pseudomonadota bacterium]